MVLLTLESGRPVSRLGLSVSRKTGGAVRRNRAKRCVREIFRRSPELRQPGLDLCVILKPEALSASAAELREELHRLRENAKASSSARRSAS